MTKEEILKQSRKENSTGDEREQQIGLQAGYAGYAGCTILCSAAWLLNFAFEGPSIISHMIMFIFTGTLAIEKCAQAVKRRTNGSILAAILWAPLCIVWLYVLVLSYLGGI